MVHEYFVRQTLAKLGYQSETRDLVAWKADAFHAIEGAVDQHRAKEMERAHKRR